MVELLPPLSCTSTCHTLVVEDCETTLILSSCNGGVDVLTPSRYTSPVMPTGTKAGPSKKKSQDAKDILMFYGGFYYNFFLFTLYM